MCLNCPPADSVTLNVEKQSIPGYWGKSNTSQETFPSAEVRDAVADTGVNPAPGNAPYSPLPFGLQGTPLLNAQQAGL